MERRQCVQFKLDGANLGAEDTTLGGADVIVGLVPLKRYGGE